MEGHNEDVSTVGDYDLYRCVLPFLFVSLGIKEKEIKKEQRVIFRLTTILHVYSFSLFFLNSV